MHVQTRTGKSERAQSSGPFAPPMPPTSLPQHNDNSRAARNSRCSFTFSTSAY